RPFLDFVHPDDRERTVLESGKLSRGEDTVAFENRYRHKDGSWRWLLWTAKPPAPHGPIYAEARDTTTRRARHAETERLSGDVRSANKELKDSSHVVSHALKAPLRGIGSLAQWILQDEGERLSAEGRSRLDMLLGRVRRMGDLIDGIL